MVKRMLKLERRYVLGDVWAFSMQIGNDVIEAFGEDT